MAFRDVSATKSQNAPASDSCVSGRLGGEKAEEALLTVRMVVVQDSQKGGEIEEKRQKTPDDEQNDD